MQFFPSACSRLFSVLILILILNTEIFAQTSENSLPIDSSPDSVFMVIVQGNEKTKEVIIRREMKLQPGQPFSREEAERDRLRIQNLGIFNRVEINTVPTKKGQILVVTVSEMWYIFPFPIIFRNERDWSRISVGAGLLYTNFRGRREVIDFRGWLGFNPAARLTYSNPWILGKLKFYTSVSVFGQEVRNLSFTVQDSSVNETRFGFDWRIGKRFGHSTFIDVNMGYKRLSFPAEISGAALNASGTDHLPTIGFTFRYDNRDLWEYAHRGNFVKLWATKTGLPGKTVNYARFGADLRKYFPVKTTTLAVRTAANLSGGSIPIYDQVHFGFLTRIRGHFRERQAGENRWINSAEFRFPIRKISYHSWGPFQSMGTYGANLRFGISGALFVDTGAVWFRNNGLSKEDFISGWGGGLHFFLPYNMLIRTEYAFKADWDGQFIVDALVWF